MASARLMLQGLHPIDSSSTTPMLYALVPHMAGAQYPPGTVANRTFRVSTCILPREVVSNDVLERRRMSLCSPWELYPRMSTRYCIFATVAKIVILLQKIVRSCRKRSPGEVDMMSRCCAPVQVCSALVTDGLDVYCLFSSMVLEGMLIRDSVVCIASSASAIDRDTRSL